MFDLSEIDRRLVYLFVFSTFLKILFFFIIRYWAQGAQFQKKDIRIDGKVVVITGANTGIGKETALELANRGGKIYLACRNIEKAEKTREEIVKKTGNAKVFVRQLDLSSFASVRKFAEEFQKDEAKLHILINNAGIFGIDHTITDDGVELHMAINHFGHFLLTNILLKTIIDSAPSRIINVACLVHRFGSINQDDINLEKSYNKYSAYCHSKLANVLFTRELSNRLIGTGVVANSLHPGIVNTDIKRHSIMLKFLALSFLPFCKTPKSGAQTTIALALDPDLEEISGKYFSNCKVVSESEAARSDDTAKWLWETSEKATALKSKF